MTFDPSIYAKTGDIQIEPELPDEEWIGRFIAHMIHAGVPVADESFKSDVASCAEKIAASYLADRKEYIDPEEAADTDIGYWESEE